MKKLFTLLYILISFSAKADYWTQKADFTGTARAGAVYLTINNKGYFGLGTDSFPVFHYVNDFWEYDATADTWTQKANFPGIARYTFLTFSINSKGYVGTGYNGTCLHDMWEYNGISNTWMQKADFPGIARQAAISININNSIYAGLGGNGSNLLTDFYSYDDINDTWTPVTAFVGAGRGSPFSFSLNGKGYIGTGIISYPSLASSNDMWEYDPVLSVWTQKANFPGLPRFATCFFDLNGKGYAGLGRNATNFFHDFYEYDAGLNLWTQKANHPFANGLSIAGGFSINNNGYFCSEHTMLGLINEVWQYIPDVSGVNEFVNTDKSLSISPNPAKDFIIIKYSFKEKEKINLTITDVNGNIVHQSPLAPKGEPQMKISVEDLSAGIYFVELTNGKQKAVKKFVKE